MSSYQISFTTKVSQRTPAAETSSSTNISLVEYEQTSEFLYFITFLMQQSLISYLCFIPDDNPRTLQETWTDAASPLTRPLNPPALSPLSCYTVLLQRRGHPFVQQSPPPPPPPFLLWTLNIIVFLRLPSRVQKKQGILHLPSSGAKHFV